MTTETQTYASKATATRGARRAGIENFEVYEIDGRWAYRDLDAAEEIEEVEEVAVDETDADEESKGDEMNEELDLELASVEEIIENTTADGILRRSLIEGPCYQVWAIAEYMLSKDPNARRKDIIAACVARGIAFYTARTQYQLYRKALAASKTVAPTHGE